MWKYRPQRPLVFSHVPKTAGSSLREAVRASVQPEVVFTGFGRVMLGSFSDPDSLHRSVRRQLAFAPGELPDDVQFIAGHIAPSTTRERFPEADHFTVLREPRVRLISQWLFARAHSDFNLRRMGDLGAWMRAARANLLEYMDNPAVASHADNGIVRFLLWPHELMPDDGFIDPAHDDELFEQAVSLLDTFAYAGIVENTDFVAELGEWLGRPLSLPRLNEVERLQQPDSPDLAAEVSGKASGLLEWRTRIDTRLWEHLAARSFSPDESDLVRQRAFDDAVERYSGMVREPVRLGYPRRLVEASYGLLTRFKWGS